MAAWGDEIITGALGDSLSSPEPLRAIPSPHDLLSQPGWSPGLSDLSLPLFIAPLVNKLMIAEELRPFSVLLWVSFGSEGNCMDSLEIWPVGSCTLGRGGRQNSVCHLLSRLTLY